MTKLKGKPLLVCALSIGLVAAPVGLPAAHAAPPSKGGSPVQVWLTDVSSEKWLERQSDTRFETKQTTNPLAIKVDDNVKYQEITGFGAALTDSSAWVINELPAESRDNLMKNLFDPVDGAGLNMIRVPMGASDFTASGFYTYDDLPKGETDPTLSNFSIAHDEQYIIPQLQQALALNPAITFTATPWSPPGWMKTSDDLIGGTLKDEYEPVLAQYFVKFIQAYDEAGLPIHYVTPQNEPQAAPSWPGMEMTPAQQARVIKEMGDAFAADDISTEILSWDHNWDVPSYPEAVYNDPASADYAVGAAWHIYSGSPIYQTFAHNDYPAKRNYLTEATGGTYQTTPEVAFHDAFNTWVIDNMRNWGNGVMLWNIALDPEGGPVSGIPLNRGLVVADPQTGDVSYNGEYYALAHASKFVDPGAHRIYSNSFGAGSVENVAFQNPDGSKVVLAYNDSDAAQTISVADGTQSFDYTLGAGTAVTFIYSGPSQKGKTAAPNVVDPNHDFVFKASTSKQRDSNKRDKVTITYDPDLLPIQNTVVSGDDLLTYSLPVGASITPPGNELDRSGWTIEASANSGGDAATNAIDGDVHTKWRTGIRAKNGDYFQIDLGASTTVSKIVLDNSEEDAFEAIADYQVYVSEDGENWGAAVARGRGPFGSVSIALQPQAARYVRIVSTDDSFHFHWSIGEVKVYGADRGSGSFAAPEKVSKPLQRQGWTSPDGAKVTVVYNGDHSAQTFRASADGSYAYTLPAGTSAMFTTHERPDSATPAFGNLTPNRGLPGNRLTITGSGFGESQDWGTVFFGSVPARIESWSDTRIIAHVPRLLPSGKYEVTVNGSGGELATGGATFTLLGLGTPLDREGWTATASDVSTWDTDVVEHVLDGDIDTRYASGTGQYEGMWLEVDMGQPQTFNRVVLDAGTSFGDTARSADVFVSDDGDDWTKVTSMLANGQPVQLASFEEQTARYIKVVNTRSAGNWWSIAEFGVYHNNEPDPEPEPEVPLARDGWSATASDESPWPNDSLVHILDGDASSRYASGTGQYEGMWVQVDMASARTFNKVELDPGASPDDYLGNADVYVSSDGEDWTKVASIAGAGQPTQVATFATRTARYIKVVSTAGAGNWWSIAEFNVYYDPELDVPLARDGWSATASDESPWPNDALVHILDGDPISRYSSGTSQYDGMWIQVDMGEAKAVNRVELDSGPNADDYARSGDVHVSEDGDTWTKVATIEGNGQPLQSASFATQTVRYIKVVNTATAGNWWSVTEFNVYG